MPCVLTVQHIQHKHQWPRQDFFYTHLLSLCTSTVLVSASWLSFIMPFVFTIQHITQTSMPSPGFEPAMPPRDRPKTNLTPRAHRERQQTALTHTAETQRRAKESERVNADVWMVIINPTCSLICSYKRFVLPSSGWLLSTSATLKMEAIRCSETPVNVYYVNGVTCRQTVFLSRRGQNHKCHFASLNRYVRLAANCNG